MTQAWLFSSLDAWSHSARHLPCSGAACDMQDLALAVRALSELKIATQGLPSIPALPVHLILAGGYDARLAENKEVYEELHRLVAALGLQSQVESCCHWACVIWLDAQKAIVPACVERLMVCLQQDARH